MIHHLHFFLFIYASPHASANYSSSESSIHKSQIGSRWTLVARILVRRQVMVFHFYLQLPYSGCLSQIQLCYIASTVSRKSNASVWAFCHLLQLSVAFVCFALIFMVCIKFRSVFLVLLLPCFYSFAHLVLIG